ncbi:3-galactosyl-N-acetylglucosaminide 4-alpha-L-fucosyltransferase FUT3-like [Acropora muricata]|uniref:3-galactosyl-N-acetylglucosaminide 4-alpha-L-fucosyltransferase FUT3-like n=1 Tax=Acropora muricata TaxID=159855 RepID=UPI0034E382E2
MTIRYKKNPFLLLAIILVSFVIIAGVQRWLLGMDFSNGFQLHETEGIFSITSERRKLKKEKGLKVILFYTTWYKSLQWPGIANGLELNVSCGEQTCRFTHNRDELQRSDGVLFYGKDLPLISHLKKIEKTKPSKQRWIFFLRESPINALKDPASINGMFNWTMTYRLDSDFFLPYGSYVQLKPDEIDRKQKNYAEGKDKLVAWIASHCGVLRDEFVRKLLKYIKVDIFGSCANKFNQHESCPKGSQKCNQKLQRYKFYLSFENSFCIDYITEKYWNNPLSNNIVPVVMGGASYEKLAIPGSFINIVDFESVEAVAKYLIYLNANDTAYNEYFRWKKEFKVVSSLDSWPCMVCKALNNHSIPAKVYDNLGEFWGVAKNCGRNVDTIRRLIADAN